MNQPHPTSAQTVSAADWATRAFFFLVMALVMFTYPLAPANELDPSWRMVLGRCFADGRQFGTEVVFTYGPLGFLMGKTYSGLHYTSFLVWQFFQATVFTLLIFRQGLRLQGYGRYLYFVFFTLLGVTYDDALHQMVIALAGFELLRRAGDGLRLLPALLGVLLGVLGLIKFTNLMLGLVFIGCTAGLLLWRRRPRDAAWLAGWSIGTFLFGWVLCGQNLLNLPDYLYNSWEISQGYSEVMGLPTPPEGLLIGLITLTLVILYVLNYLRCVPDLPRGLAMVGGLGAYIFLNWKHGFVRADGHMIGFYYAVLVPATAFPTLLDDGPRRFRLQGTLLRITAVVAVIGVGITLPGLLRGILSQVQERIAENVSRLLNPTATLAYYDHLLGVQRAYHDLPETRAVVGRGTVDVLGFEQGIALFNDFNYHPRPVFQSYSAYRPHLTRLNFKHYASDRAPEFVLLKLQSIDRRLVTFDDSEVLSLLVHRYEFVLSEKGIQLWRRKPGAFDRHTIVPRPLVTSVLAPGQPFLAEDYIDRKLWAVVDFRPSLLGRLRSFLYKLPIVSFQVRNTQGITTDYRLPLPQGRTGFIINPVVEDLTSYMHFAGGQPDRFLSSFTLAIDPEDRIWFQDEYKVTLYELPPSTAGQKFFEQATKRLFNMFNVVPTTYSSMTPISDGEIDGRKVMVFHAPSELTLNVPKGATTFSGAFGYLEAAYTKGNATDGADFAISWVLGTEEYLLLERNLDPLPKLSDRGLHSFRVKLPPRDGGYLRLKITPGPKGSFAWDWTAWTALTIE